MDINDFDASLKRKLYLDLAYRSFIWLSISTAVFSYAILLEGVEPVANFLRVVDSQMFPLNGIGLIPIILSVVALFLKDLEVITKNMRTKKVTTGYLGGFVRRTAGDTTLWLLGLQQAMLATFIATLIFENGLLSHWYVIIGSLVLIFLMIFFTGFLNIQVRRNGPSILYTLIVGTSANKKYNTDPKLTNTAEKVLLAFWVFLIFILEAIFIIPAI